ncbi:MAG: hypothetical protein ACTSRZ_08000 [Promethearchaeota archaeon]
MSNNQINSAEENNKAENNEDLEKELANPEELLDEIPLEQNSENQQNQNQNLKINKNISPHEEDIKQENLEIDANPSVNLEKNNTLESNLLNIDLEKISFPKESPEITDVKNKLKEAYYEIGRAAANAADKMVLYKQYGDAIKFYKNALFNFENGDAQLLNSSIKIENNEKSKKPTKEALDPILKFKDESITGYAAVINYNLPSSTSIPIRAYQDLHIPLDWFHPQNALHSMTVEEIKERIDATPIISKEIPPFKLKSYSEETSISNKQVSYIRSNLENNSSKIFFSLKQNNIERNFANTTSNQESSSQEPIQQNIISPEKVGELLLQYPRGHEFWQQFPKGHPLHVYSYKSKEDEMKDDEQITLQLRRDVKNLHNQIKETAFNSMEIIEDIDNIVHDAIFNKKVIEIAKLLKEYQKYDPYSYISKERDFLEVNLKKIPVEIKSVVDFIDQLIDKLKKELPMDKKIERENRIAEEIKRFKDAIEEKEREYEQKQNELKSNYEMAVNEEKVNSEKIIHQKEEQLKAQIQSQLLPLINEFNQLSSKKAKTEQIINDITNVASLYIKLSNLKNTINSYKRNLSLYSNIINKNVYLQRKYSSDIKNYSSKLAWINRRISEYDKLTKRYNIQRRFFWWLNTNYRNSLRKLRKYQSMKGSVSKSLRNLKHLSNQASKNIQIYKGKYNKEMSNYNKIRNQKKQIENLFSKELIKLKTKYPTIAKDPKQTIQYKKSLEKILNDLNLKIKEINNKLAELKKNNIEKELIPLYTSRFNKLKALKDKFLEDSRKLDEELAKIKVDLKKEHDANIETIREFYLQFLPPEIETIITNINNLSNTLEDYSELIKNLAIQSLEKIEQIYQIADKWSYKVFCNKIASKKGNKTFANDLKSNFKEKRKKKNFASLFEEKVSSINQNENKNILTTKLEITDDLNELDDIKLDNIPIDFDIESEIKKSEKNIIGAVISPEIASFIGINEFDYKDDSAPLILDIEFQEIEPKTVIDNIFNEIEQSNLNSTTNTISNVFTNSELNHSGSDIYYQKLDDELFEPIAYTLQTKKVGDVFVTTFFPDQTKPINEWPTESQIAELAERGYSPKVFKRLDGEYEVRFIKTKKEIYPKVFIIYEYNISSFLGDYGAGKTIKTFSLLPGESTTISIKTWQTSTETREKAQSILESNSSTAAESFSDALQRETQKSRESTRTVDTYAKVSAEASVSASASYGIGSASATAKYGFEAGVAASAKQTQKETARALSNSVRKHASTQSAKRQSSISEVASTQVTKGQETGVTREIKNINLSRVLNFVFRELNQEYITIIHLSDIKIAFSTGFSADYHEIALYELDSFIEQYFRDGYDLEDDEEIATGLRIPIKEKVKKYIFQYLKYIYDYKDRPFEVIEPIYIPGVEPPIPSGMYRFKNQPFRLYCQEVVEKNPELTDKFADVLKGHIDHGVDGIIVDISRHIMRTDAIIVDVFLGKGVALDDYAIASQIEAIREKQLQNAKIQLGLDIVNMFNMTPEEAKLKAQLYYLVFGNPNMTKVQELLVQELPENKNEKTKKEENISL